MLRIHEALSAHELPNCRTLASQFEVSQKTIQRDIDFMRDRIGLPIGYDDARFGFHYTKPVPSFPNIEVSEGELVALLVAQKALAQYRGTSYEAPLKRAFRKLASGLQDKIAFQWEDLDSTLSFRSIGTTVADMEIFEAVSRALLRSKELSFEYHKLGSATYEARRVRPYHLACIDQQWYLFGFDLDRDEIRTFVLPRMRKLRILKTGFRRPADFSIADHLTGSLGVFSGSGSFQVCVEFDEFAGRLVSERQWHASQKITALEGGRIQLRLQLASLEEVARWVLSWGAHAKVLDPPELRARIRSTAEAILAEIDSNSKKDGPA